MLQKLSALERKECSCARGSTASSQSNEIQVEGYSIWERPGLQKCRKRIIQPDNTIMVGVDDRYRQSDADSPRSLITPMDIERETRREVMRQGSTRIGLCKCAGLIAATSIMSWIIISEYQKRMNKSY